MQDEQKMCRSGQPRRIEKFLEVCLLLLLLDRAGYGYGLIEQLVPFGFSQDQLNVSTLYRTLRKMESAGTVISDWEKGDQGPKRRVYEITAQGKAELHQWVRVMKARKARIEQLIAKYDSLTDT